MRKTILLSALAATALIATSASASAAPQLEVETNAYPSFMKAGQPATLELTVRNTGDAPTSTSEPISVTATLPSELTATSVTDGQGAVFNQKAWDCSISPDGHTVKCEGPSIFGSFFAIEPGDECRSLVGPCWIRISVDVAPSAAGIASPQIEACGGGASCFSTNPEFEFREDPFGLIDWDSDWTVDENGKEFTQAGGHPYEVVNNFELSTTLELIGGEFRPHPAGDLRNAIAKLPSGFIGAPNAVPTCEGINLLVPANETAFIPNCPVDSIVGMIQVRDGVPPVPIFNMKAPPGVPAQFGFQIFSFPGLLNATLRSDGDFGVDISSINTPQGTPIKGATTTFWGTPADPSHDKDRCVAYGRASGEEEDPTPKGKCDGKPGTTFGPHSASVGNPKAFLTNPTLCTPEGVGKPIPFHVDSWDRPAQSDDLTMITHKAGDRSSPVGNTGCDIVPFNPKLTVQPSTDQADSPTGMELIITVPKDGINNPDGIAQSSLKDATVRLPEGMTLNPSYGDGVATCSTGQIGLTTGDAPEVHFNLEPNHCPDAAQIGSVHIETPLLDFPIDGGVYLAEQNNPAKPGVENPFNSLLALYMIAANPQHGVQLKLAGNVERDPVTGQVITTFKDNPQIGFSKFVLKFKGGQRAPLATPSSCGTYTTVGEFTPYARPGKPRIVSDDLKITRGADAAGAACVSRPEQRPFHPTLIAGTENNTAGSFSPFALRMLRADGEQEITTFSADLPPGLVAKLAGIPKCPDAAIEAAKRKSGLEEKLNPSCSAASQVGQTLVGAGTGSILTYSPGKVYLAGPYKGTPLSVVTITPATVGPFDLDTVVVRSAFKVDRETAQVHIDSRASDPIPHIFQGIALHIREIRVLINRPNFTINPTNCDPMAFTAHLTGTGATFGNSADDVGVDLSAPYEAADCQALPFKPKLTFMLKGGTKRGDFPAFQATLKARPGDANIAGSTVVLPRSEFIEQGHIRTVCTRVQFNANQCPPGSIYGHAKATTPLFDKPLEGPVYLRSNGGERLLPDLVVSLNGEINVALAGYVDSVKGKVRNRFEVVPDAPVTSFELKMQGGKKGLLVNHLNLCKVTSKAEVKLTGQNGKVVETRPKMGTSCKGKGRKRGK